MAERFVVKRPMSAPADCLAVVKSLPGIHIVDVLDDMALLVEVEPGALEENRERLAGLLIAPERTYGLPDNRPSFRGDGGNDDD